MANNHANIPLNKLLLVLFLIAILYSASGCGGDAKEVVSHFDDRYYTFDSATILDRLDRGDLDLFTRLEATPEPKSAIPSVTVSWTQTDYFRVAQAVPQYIWQESLGTLDLSDAFFTVDCKDIMQGTYSMVDFMFYKVIQTEEEETRIQYHITVIPSQNMIETSRAEYQPNVLTIKPTDLSQYPITAERALQIAEDNGGAQRRSEVNNSCMINGMVNGLDGWTVFYQVRSKYIWNIVYEIIINPQTGSFKVMLPKK